MDSSDEGSDSGGSDNEGTSGYRKGAHTCVAAVAGIEASIMSSHVYAYNVYGTMY